MVPHWQQEGRCGRCRIGKTTRDLEMEMHDSLDNAIRGAIEMRAEIDRLRAALKRIVAIAYVCGSWNEIADVANDALGYDP